LQSLRLFFQICFNMNRPLGVSFDH
jgi:hypothetical protein